MIVVLEGCGSNLASIQYALKRLDKAFVLTRDQALIEKADYVIIPGVSTAKRALESLNDAGLAPTIKNLRCPVLGICSGMQILYDWCEEGGLHGLGILSGQVKKLNVSNQPLPHMGWNNLCDLNPQSKILKGIKSSDYVYFVHSFAAGIDKNTVAVCDYAEKFTAVVEKDNFYGTQFHPEKSGKIGIKILNNFLSIGNKYANNTSG